MYKIEPKLALVLFTSDCLCTVMNNYSQTLRCEAENELSSSMIFNKD